MDVDDYQNGLHFQTIMEEIASHDTEALTNLEDMFNYLIADTFGLVDIFGGENTKPLRF